MTAEKYLFPKQHSLCTKSSPRRAIAFDQRRGHARIALRGLELSRHAGKEAVQHQLFLYADDAVIRSAHAYVRLIGSAAGQHAVVSRRNVRMCSQHRGHAAIEIPSESCFL